MGRRSAPSKRINVIFILSTHMVQSVGSRFRHTPGLLAALFGDPPTCDLALEGVQLPLPVLQWSECTERTQIEKKHHIFISTFYHSSPHDYLYSILFHAHFSRSSWMTSSWYAQHQARYLRRYRRCFFFNPTSAFSFISNNKFRRKP